MKKRPAQDESIFTPYMRKLYSRTVLGRPGDSKEEAVKYTQTISEKLHAESQTEWISRLHEYTYGCETILKDAMENEVTPEAQEEATKELTFGAYAPGVFPAVPVLPVKMIPTMLNQVYGPSADVCWVNLDEFTMESQWVSGWHFEKGVQSMNNLWYLDDDWKQMLDRRHMRTGEKFKQLCVQRTFVDGANMASDVLKDIRNEKDPEHSDSPLYFHGIVNNTNVDAQYGSRNGFEMVHLMNAYITSKIGFPYQTYSCFLPMPNMYDLLLQLPVESVPPQIMGLYMGTDKWVSCYTLSHLETSHEIFGEEMIPPTPAESINSSVKYGADIFNYPASFKQSKFLYGQEAMCRAPTEYPCAQKAIPTIMDATAEIEAARNEHPDWLTQ